MRTGALIDYYARATCIPALRAGRSTPRKWDHFIEAAGTCQGRILGEVASTGFVAVVYPPDSAQHSIAHLGEKSNPTDVRIDLQSCRLYMRSAGSPLFVDRAPTWLVEYDLRNRRQLKEVIVEPQALPPVCLDSQVAG